jgi:phospholipase D1/2
VGQEQHEIQTQMIKLISHATDFIYIENQFFQTEFGRPTAEPFSEDAEQQRSGPIKYLMNDLANDLKARLSSAGEKTDSPEPNKALLPHNKIGQALGDRIAQAVRMGHPFHLYLVLPVHPEGALNDITVVGQIHWTMQSLVFADDSLVNRIKRAIKAREMCRNLFRDSAWAEALQKAEELDGKEPKYAAVTEEQWGEYLTLLNLRNCQRVGGVLRTEQIYVHSKLLIVDDRHVLMGSANINDRSQSGKRDSEIAVMLFDTALERKTLSTASVNVNPLARKLRMELWRKHFGLTGGGNDIVKPAKEVENLIERPAAKETIKAIQTLAADNASAYQKTFPFVPWSKAKSSPGIKGFFTALPYNWTIGEYNHPGEMSAMALTDASDVFDRNDDLVG